MLTFLSFIYSTSYQHLTDWATTAFPWLSDITLSWFPSYVNGRSILELNTLYISNSTPLTPNTINVLTTPKLLSPLQTSFVNITLTCLLAYPISGKALKFSAPGYGLPRQPPASDWTRQWCKNTSFLTSCPAQDPSISSLCTGAPFGAGWDFLRAVAQPETTFYWRHPKLKIGWAIFTPPTKAITLSSETPTQVPLAQRPGFQLRKDPSLSFELISIQPLAFCSTSPRSASSFLYVLLPWCLRILFRPFQLTS